MDTIRQYILSVACVTVLSGMIQLLFSGGKNSLIRLVTGLVVTITVLSPILKIDVKSFDGYFDQISTDSAWAVGEGETAAMEMSAAIIKERAETYILDKAAGMGTEIAVDVMLSEEAPQIPIAVTVHGSVSPYVRTQLTNYIIQDLGVNKEDLKWIS